MKGYAMFQQRVLLLIILGLIILPIGGCLSEQQVVSLASKQGTAAAAEPIKITFWNINTTDERQIQWEKSIQSFNESQALIQVIPYFYEIEAYKNKLSVAMMSGKLPDLFYYWTGEPFKYMVDSQIVADLTEMIEAQSGLADQFYRGALHSAQYYDRIYGIPISQNQVLLWYNKDVFAKLGLSPPATWDELIYIIEELQNNQIDPIAVSGKERWPLLHWYAYLSNRIGGASPFERAVKGAGDFTEPSFVEAALLFRELIDRKAFIPGFLGLDLAAAEEAFINGEAALYLQGDWSAEKLLSNHNIGYVSFPIVYNRVENNDHYGGYSVGWAIARNSNQEAAFQVLMHMMSETEQTAYVEQTGSPSSLQDLKLNPTNMDEHVYQYVTNKDTEVNSYFKFYDQELDSARSQLLLDAIMKIAGSEHIDENDIIYLLEQIQ